jgi:colanic acid/amylovoran biosynthesis glycosyltransferase
MTTIAYLANQFPSPVEPYVGAEIEELRRRGVRVIAGSVWKQGERVRSSTELAGDPDFIVLQPFQITTLAKALWLCLRRWRRIADLLERVMLQGRETPLQRAKALLHTWLGACYALRLQEREVEHIHVHHGYFGAWIAIVAARLLNVGCSITLHGSDLLTHAAYLDAKLKSCQFCMTISEYNRRYILEHYPAIEPGNVVVARLGVDVPEPRRFPAARVRDFRLWGSDSRFHLLAVGRLHAVKDHAFLVRACAQLCQRGLDFQCEIAGEGPERRNLDLLIREYGLEERVHLLGHVPHEQQDALYQRADVCVLTSRSEGIPLALMEAMARAKIVVAPAITGIPELVVAGLTGFLYQPGSVEDFAARILLIHQLITPGLMTHELMTHRITPRGLTSTLLASRLHGVPSAASQLDRVRNRAREQVRRHFNRQKNLEAFGDLFLRRVLERGPERTAGPDGHSLHEDSLLQQI